MSASQTKSSQQRGATGHNEQHCPACGSSALTPFFSIERAPVFCNVQHTTRDAALAAPTAPIALSLCEHCELIANLDFDPRKAEYEGGYENSLHFSPHFRKYAEHLATSLIERYDIRNKDVVDIGCGMGDFLKLMARLGNNRGFGFDPSYQEARKDKTAEHEGDSANVTIIAEAYGESLMSKPAALVCCRHVLEHIQHPLEFLRSVRRTIGDRTDTIVFFEVPCANWTINQLGIWDILYEHCSYFTPTALRNVFVQAGFEVLRVEETYGGQFLTLESTPSATRHDASWKPASENVRHNVDNFHNAYESRVCGWRKRLADMQSKGETAVLWGAGTKGVMFLNTLNISHELIPGAVDVNPHKHGRFIAGTGQQIIAPDSLRTLQPNFVIVMNPLYVDEIKATLANLGLTPNVVTV